MVSLTRNISNIDTMSRDKKKLEKQEKYSRRASNESVENDSTNSFNDEDDIDDDDVSHDDSTLDHMNSNQNHRSRIDSTSVGPFFPSTPDRNFPRDKPLASHNTPETVTSCTVSLSTSHHGESITNSPTGDLHAQFNQSQRRTPSRNLYQAQLRLLSGLSGGSIFIFLLFFLNGIAFAALMSTILFSTLLLNTMYNYIMFLHQNGELSIYEYLPTNIQQLLTSTSIHEWLTDSSAFLESRYLLLYFIPGLSEEQVLRLVQRLPPRHREMALAPGGLARMVLPESVWNILAPARLYGRTQQVNNTTVTDLVPLPSIAEEDDETELDGDIHPRQVTVQEAFRGILHTARQSFFTGYNDSRSRVASAWHSAESRFLHFPRRSSDEQRVVADISMDNDLSWDTDNNNDTGPTHPLREVTAVTNTSTVHHSGNEDDSESGDSDLGINITSDDFTGHLAEGQLTRLSRFLGVGNNSLTGNSIVQRLSELPTTVTTIIRAQPPPLPPLQASPSEEQEEQELEQQLLSEAFTSMIDNYRSLAIRIVSDTVSSTIDAIAPSIIRSGVQLISLSSVGLLGYFVSPMGAFSRVWGRTGGGRSPTSERVGNYIVMGLFSTIFVSGGAIAATVAVRSISRRLAESSSREENAQLPYELLNEDYSYHEESENPTTTTTPREINETENEKLKKE